MANTELEDNIDLAIQRASKSVEYADTILGNLPLDENEGVNISLAVSNSARFSITGSTFNIDSDIPPVPELPYIELEYIELTGNQYINDISLSSTYKFEFDVLLNSTSSYYNFYDNNSQNPMLWITEENKIELNANARADILTGTRVLITDDNSGNIDTLHTVYQNDILKVSSNRSTGTYTVHMFHRGSSDGFKGKIYGFKLYSR